MALAILRCLARRIAPTPAPPARIPTASITTYSTARPDGQAAEREAELERQALLIRRAGT